MFIFGENTFDKTLFKKKKMRILFQIIRGLKTMTHLRKSDIKTKAINKSDDQIDGNYDN